MNLKDLTKEYDKLQKKIWGKRIGLHLLWRL